MSSTLNLAPSKLEAVGFLSVDGVNKSSLMTFSVNTMEGAMYE
jgi:hypothetical protein